mmetsp:Transcript_22509/g.72771  ORF Transcript_22509/g.72771 Transcript_22509/m.72771 type:complete len:236 (+) Transcript_22509:823-1530(+)
MQLGLPLQIDTRVTGSVAAEHRSCHETRHVRRNTTPSRSRAFNRVPRLRRGCAAGGLAVDLRAPGAPAAGPIYRGGAKGGQAVRAAGKAEFGAQHHRVGGLTDQKLSRMDGRPFREESTTGCRGLADTHRRVEVRVGWGRGRDGRTNARAGRLLASHLGQPSDNVLQTLGTSPRVVLPQQAALWRLQMVRPQGQGCERRGGGTQASPVAYPRRPPADIGRTRARFAVGAARKPNQ